MVLSRFLRLGCLLLSVVATTPALAAPKKTYAPSASAYALTQCLLEDDSKVASTSTRTACCSKEVGYCVICPVKGPLNCEIVPYRQTIQGMPPLTRKPGTRLNDLVAPVR